MPHAKNKKTWVGFDLGATKMMALACNDSFEILARTRRNTKGHVGVEAGLNRIRDTIQKTLEEARLTSQQLAGIGIACPGPLNLEKGILLEAPNLGWRNAHIKEFFEKEFSCPVVISNDVDAGVYGEFRFGAGRGGRCVVGIFPGTGIGGGCVYEGKIIRGKSGSCMEIGHLPIMADGPLCGCGRYGCLEAVASRIAVAGAAAQAARRGDAPVIKELAGTDISNIRSSVLAEAIKKGDIIIEQIVKNAAKQIGIALAGVINLLAPDLVVLGGGMVEAMPELFVDGVLNAANCRVMPTFENSFKVVPTQLGDDASALGAAAWAKSQISP